MTAVREVIDDHARQAGQVAIERRSRWQERIDQIVTTRDDTSSPNAARPPQATATDQEVPVPPALP